MNNMASKFDDSAAKVRDELLKEGLIVADQYKNIGLTEKRNYAYKLTGKKLSQDTQAVTYWSDGLVKSTGNAFDWRSKQSTLISKQDIANAKNAGRPHNYNPHPITTFSRA
jgi:hypothetical protein